MTTIVLNPEQFTSLTPLEIKEIAQVENGKHKQEEEEEIEEVVEQQAEASSQTPATISTIEQPNTTANATTTTITKEVESSKNPNGTSPSAPIVAPSKKSLVALEKGQVIDVEGNNARASYHLSLLVAIGMAMFCLMAFAFIPFLIVYLKFRSNPTGSPRVHVIVERSRWIAIGILCSNLFLLLIGAIIVLIVLFAIGTLRP